jgi:myo-inositol-1(or 4)-monophosphatase
LQVTDLAVTRSQDCTRLTDAVREAGAVALKTFGSALKSWVKHGDSPVSEADIAVNELLRTRLITAETDDGWLSEESENDPARLTKPRVWVIDPIDGTRAYIAGRTDWSISAALVEDGRPTVAAVFAPVSDEMFIAVEGKGATRNDAPMQVSAGSGLDGARTAGPKRALESIAVHHPGLVIVPRIHSLALRLVRVAQGELDGAIAGGNSHDWDLAAADLLVHEAGGMLTSLDGKPLTYNLPNPVHSVLVAAGRERHSALLEFVRAQHNSAA